MKWGHWHNELLSLIYPMLLTCLFDYTSSMRSLLEVNTCTEKAAQRRPSGAPLAASMDRGVGWDADGAENNRQLPGRASGVTCEAMLGGGFDKNEKNRVSQCDN
jgi:hypothetical protein